MAWASGTWVKPCHDEWEWVYYISSFSTVMSSSSSASSDAVLQSDGDHPFDGVVRHLHQTISTQFSSELKPLLCHPPFVISIEK